MRDRLTSTLRRGMSMFGSFTAGQKAVTIVAVVGLAVGGYFFATWASQPTYAPLFSNLAPADASAIVDKLVADGTRYKLANGGQTIMVPQSQVYDVRIKMSGQGLPAQSDSGYSLLDKQGVMTSEFMQQIGYRRAMEGELAKTIKSINGVTAATVHLAIPQKDVFTDDQQKPTASVLVATAIGKRIGDDQVQAIVHLVASSVEGLEPDKVTVVGADGRVLSTTGTDGSSTGSDARTSQTQQYEQRLGTAVQAMLDQVVGPDHAVVQVTADLDFDSTETKTQTYVADPSTPPLTESKKTEAYGSGTSATGVLGPDNIQVPTGSGASPGSYMQQSDIRTNAIGMVTETRKSAPGAVRRLSVAVLLDSRTAKGADQAQLQELVSKAVGLDAKRGDAIALTTMPFDQGTDTATKTELTQTRKAEKQQQLYSTIKTGATIAVVVLLLLVAMLRSRRGNKRLTKLIQAEVAERDTEGIGSARPGAIGSGTSPSGVPALEHAPPQDPRAVQREVRQREIAVLVEQQPDEVAQLLRGWLADRRG
jgi:flagellar M-ring protein FliF